MMADQFDAFESDDVPILQRVLMFGPDDAQDTVVVELLFDDFGVFIFVNQDDDTLLCTRTPPDAYLRENRRAVSSTFWKDIEGKALTDAWQMHNDRGYRDAVQLRFRDSPSAGPYTIIQFSAIASRITVSQLEVVREHK